MGRGAASEATLLERAFLRFRRNTRPSFWQRRLLVVFAFDFTVGSLLEETQLRGVFQRTKSATGERERRLFSAVFTWPPAIGRRGATLRRRPPSICSFDSSDRLEMFWSAVSRRNGDSLSLSLSTYNFVFTDVFIRWACRRRRGGSASLL